MTQARIGKVKLKNGGAELKIFNNHKVNQSCVEHLEYLLERAKSGEVKSIMYVANWGDGVTSGYSDQQELLRMLGEFECMKHAIFMKAYEPA